MVSSTLPSHKDSSVLFFPFESLKSGKLLAEAAEEAATDAATFPSDSAASRSETCRATLRNLAASVAASTTLLYASKAAFRHVHSPSPHNMLSVAVLLALVHQVCVYTVAQIVATPLAANTLAPRARVRLVIFTTICTVLSYWFLVVLPLDTFQGVTLVGLPLIVLHRRRNSSMHYPSAASSYLLLIGGIAWIATDALSQNLSVVVILALIFNFAVLVPSTSVLFGRAAEVRSLAPWTISLLAAIWLFMEVLQSTVVMIPGFWTPSVIFMTSVSAVSAVATMAIPTSPKTSVFTPESQVLRVVLICFLSWVSGLETVTLSKLTGLGMIAAAAIVHFQYSDRSPTYSPTYPIQRTPQSWKSRKKAIFSRLAVVCVALLGIVGVFQTFSKALPHRSSRDTIAPFSDDELLHIPGEKTLGFDRIYVINLPRRTDRRDLMAARLHKLELDAYITPASTYESPAVLDRLDLLHRKALWGWFPFGSHLSRGEVALTVSQLRIFKDMVERNIPWALLLEDDVTMEKRVDSIYKPFSRMVPQDADLLYLGWCDNPPGTEVASFGPMDTDRLPRDYSMAVATHPSCTHAFAVTLKAARIMLAKFDEPHAACDDSIVELVNLGTLKAYSMHPPLITQDEETPSDLAVDGWWLPIKNAGVAFSKHVRGVSRPALDEPVNLTDADRSWAAAWREASETRSPWVNFTNVES
ncbi:hypothetical protein HKX48_001755 [Thoreauomyces humboldtii]|nr:hypothetical protein HKX48_001755 [Thoreauomyces humboldtii]